MSIRALRSASGGGVQTLRMGEIERRLDRESAEWAKAQRDAPSGFSPVPYRWWTVRGLKSLTGRRRLVAKAVFLVPITVVLIAVGFRAIF